MNATAPHASPQATQAIVQEVTIHAPAAEIFRALTTADELMRWWAAEGQFRTVYAACDLRPGGAWLMMVEGACGTEPVHTVRGVYRRVEPPHLVEFTWKRDREDWPESLVRWELEERDGTTTVRVTHSELISEAMRARNNGWPLIVRLLEKWLGSGNGSPSAGAGS